MYSDIEIQCANCIHQEVCSFTKEFLAAQKAIDNLTITLDEYIGPNGREVEMKNLRNFTWIKRVKLECAHFTSKKMMRQDSAFMANAKGVSP